MPAHQREAPHKKLRVLSAALPHLLHFGGGRVAASKICNKVSEAAGTCVGTGARRFAIGRRCGMTQVASAPRRR
jgi:hypothetical protein